LLWLEALQLKYIHYEGTLLKCSDVETFVMTL
jgi:hypothetical protein